MTARRRSLRHRHRTSKTANPKLVGFLAFLLGLSFILAMIIGLGWWGFKALANSGRDQLHLTRMVITPADEEKRPVLVVTADPHTSDVQVVVMDGDIKVPLLDEYGEYPVRSIGSLLSLDDKDKQYIRGSYSFGLSQLISNVWKVKNLPTEITPTTLQTLMDTTLQQSSDQSWWQRVKWWMWWRQLPLENIHITPVKTLADWPKVQETLEVTSTLSEHCFVTVVNTTQKSGIGGKTSQVMERSGLVVIRVTDTSPVETESKLLISPQAQANCRPVTELMIQGLPLKVPTQLSSDALGKYRADIVLVIGEDLAQKIN